jgi:hypothetical protein
MQTKVVSQLGAELHSWSGLSTVTSFDAGNTDNSIRIVQRMFMLWFLIIEGRKIL